ncbi:hypothetical protein PHMEG_00028856 [Phytophthora megakarya]|uniref:Uncharacterized protein n=1 Tax=Phytophthora megakarya TaxID=4795 RepID=A0A225V4W8_9STRA|nr:hypothetical protein PHMEG_00028856 [Phytophthora megakarya]
MYSRIEDFETLRTRFYNQFICQTPLQMIERLRNAKRSKGMSAEVWGDVISNLCDAVQVTDPQMRYQYFLVGLRNKEWKAALTMVNDIPRTVMTLLYKNMHLPNEDDGEFEGESAKKSSSESDMMQKMMGLMQQTQDLLVTQNQLMTRPPRSPRNRVSEPQSPFIAAMFEGQSITAVTENAPGVAGGNRRMGPDRYTQEGLSCVDTLRLSVLNPANRTVVVTVAYSRIIMVNRVPAVTSEYRAVRYGRLLCSWPRMGRLELRPYRDKLLLSTDGGRKKGKEVPILPLVIGTARTVVCGSTTDVDYPARQGVLPVDDVMNTACQGVHPVYDVNKLYGEAAPSVLDHLPAYSGFSPESVLPPVEDASLDLHIAGHGGCRVTREVSGVSKDNYNYCENENATKEVVATVAEATTMSVAGATQTCGSTIPTSTKADLPTEFTGISEGLVERPFKGVASYAAMSSGMIDTVLNNVSEFDTESVYEMKPPTEDISYEITTDEAGLKGEEVFVPYHHFANDLPFASIALSDSRRMIQIRMYWIL